MDEREYLAEAARRRRRAVRKFEAWRPVFEERAATRRLFAPRLDRSWQVRTFRGGWY